MPLKTDPATLNRSIGPDRQQVDYLILSDEERSKGFVRPVRNVYRHIGIAGPTHPLRELTPEELERYRRFDYVKFEIYGKDEDPCTGRFWTQAQLDAIDKGCGTDTRMGQRLAETYARQPDFYGATFCARCGTHLPVGAAGEFIWVPDGTRVGT
jgi:hypothetical protein